MSLSSEKKDESDTKNDTDLDQANYQYLLQLSKKIWWKLQISKVDYLSIY